MGMVGFEFFQYATAPIATAKIPCKKCPERISPTPNETGTRVKLSVSDFNCIDKKPRFGDIYCLYMADWRCFIQDFIAKSSKPTIKPCNNSSRSSIFNT